MGGEKSVRLFCIPSRLGSPPRRRGKAFSVLRRQFRFRITPAWAGKRPGHWGARRRCKDHPRVGGEKARLWYTWFAKRGSPPRRRGKAVIGSVDQALVGITPAWAGKSNQSTTPNLPPRDHPRVGGEKSLMTCRRVFWTGSPPRGRGKDSPAWKYISFPGITPAWAGKSFRIPGRYHDRGDHPRVGGEKWILGEMFRVK